MPDGIGQESRHDILIFCRILENILAPISHFKQQRRAEWPLFSVQTTAQHRAYLATLPAVSNSVAPDQLPFPPSVRADMAGWNMLYFTPDEFHPNPDKGDEWNRGAYLGEGLMHCGACHTPKNLAGGDKTNERLRGYALQGWFAPDLTGDPRRGLGAWSLDDIATYLKTGHNHFAAAAGPMAEVVAKSEVTADDVAKRREALGKGGE
jgi:mono/diheme cytochrome c family protein